MKQKILWTIFMWWAWHSVYGQVKYYDATAFPLYGKCKLEGSALYNRFPDSLQSISRPELWTLSTNSAGMAIRFRSNSSTISARWVLKYNNHMNHMTDTGVKGLDLYGLENGEWVYMSVGRPLGKSNEAAIISNMQPVWREYMLYLPLYDGVDSLFIGIDKEAEITQPQTELPRRSKPLVMYGTSILQGGCATRPGMAHTNILGRMLGVEVINLGFSGNAFLDLEVADLMAKVDASVFVIDCLPNSSVEMMEERLYEFYRRIRNAWPDTPILFIEDPVFTTAAFDLRMREEVTTKNKTLHHIFDKIKKQDRHVECIGLSNFLAQHKDATVDGIHFTDVGFIEYAQLLYRHLKKYVK